MADALQMVNWQEEHIKHLCEIIDNAAKVLGYDCDKCERW